MIRSRFDEPVEKANSQIQGGDGQVMNKNGFRIRRAGPGDLEALLAIESQCFSSGPYRKHQFDRSQYRYYLRSSHAINLLVLLNGVPMASLVAIAGRSARSASGRILSIAVVRRERGKGYGRRLLMKSIQLLSKRGCLRVYLEVAERAGPAAAFFQSAGFKKIRRLPDYYGPSQHGMRMALNLKSSQAS